MAIYKNLHKSIKYHSETEIKAKIYNRKCRENLKKNVNNDILNKLE